MSAYRFCDDVKEATNYILEEIKTNKLCNVEIPEPQFEEFKLLASNKKLHFMASSTSSHGKRLICISNDGVSAPEYKANNNGMTFNIGSKRPRTHNK